MDAFLLYLFTRINSVHNLAVVGLSITTLSVFVRVILTSVHAGYTKEAEAIAKLKWGKYIVVACACTSVLLILPSQRDVAIIVGGSLAKDAVLSETGQKIFTLVNSTLDRELKRLEEDKK